MNEGGRGAPLLRAWGWNTLPPSQAPWERLLLPCWDLVMGRTGKGLEGLRDLLILDKEGVSAQAVLPGAGLAALWVYFSLFLVSQPFYQGSNLRGWTRG